MFSLESKSLGYYLILEEPEADFLEDVFGYNITESLSLELDDWALSTYTWLRVFLFSSISKNCYYCIVAERLFVVNLSAATAHAIFWKPFNSFNGLVNVALR